MVHLRAGVEPVEIKGSIRLTDDALEFEHAETASVSRFPYALSRRAKRLRGSPVLMLDWTNDGERRRTAFYFVQPPPLRPAEGDLARSGPGGRSPSPVTLMRGGSRRKHTRTNAAYLTTQGTTLKQSVQRWADDLTKRIADPG